MRMPHGDVSTTLRSAQHDRKNTFLFLNSYVFVILILPLALAHEVNSPVEAGEVADEVRRKGGAPAEGVSKNI